MKTDVRNCAIYTRKSTEEGLEQEFNTLDAQRESCEAYILSQRSDGWKTVKSQYNDGGYSGGNIERPGLKKLMADVKKGKIQTVVVYKIDRLTRSLADFSKLVEVFDEYGVTFVSVTQSFNTTTSMGRLTLNVLLSFAQFEREVTGERIRDKIAASKKKGMWMGGFPPLGYKCVDKKLVQDPAESKVVNFIFNEYLSSKSIKSLFETLRDNNIKTPCRISKKGRQHGDKNYSRGHLYSILNNPIYVGKIRHKSEIYDGQHKAIINSNIYSEVQKLLRDPSTNRKHKCVKSGQLLKGLLYDIDGTIYSPTYTAKGKIRYYYYISQNLLQYRDHPKGVMARVPAHEIEKAVTNGLKSWLEIGENIVELFPASNQQTLEWVSRQDFNLDGENLRAVLNKGILSNDKITLKINMHKLRDHLMRIFNIALEQPIFEEASLSTLYQVRRANNGATVIETESNDTDCFDIPVDQLARIIKGVVWRDAHFAGETMASIAKRNSHGENYINKCIQESFVFLSV